MTTKTIEQKISELPKKMKWVKFGEETDFHKPNIKIKVDKQTD